MKPCHRTLAIVIASAGRPTVLRESLHSIWAQSVLPGQVVVAVTAIQKVDTITADQRIVATFAVEFYELVYRPRETRCS
jgi:hypothetical protein